MNKKYFKHKLTNLIVINKLVTIHNFNFSKDFKSEEEYHDFWELVFVEKNQIIATSDDKKITLRQGEILFHKPNERHSLYANGITNSEIFIISFECRSEAITYFNDKKLKLSKKYLRYIYEIIKEGKETFILPAFDPNMKKLILSQNPALGGEQLIKNYLEILLIDIMRDNLEKNKSEVFLSESEISYAICNEIDDIIDKNIYSKITIESIANECNYSKSYLFSLYKSIKGKTILESITDKKLEKAKEFLNNTTLSISDIADNLAFDTPNYFARTFKKHIGVSPICYRNIKKVN